MELYPKTDTIPKSEPLMNYTAPSSSGQVAPPTYPTYTRPGETASAPGTSLLPTNFSSSFTQPAYPPPSTPPPASLPSFSTVSSPTTFNNPPNTAGNFTYGTAPAATAQPASVAPAANADVGQLLRQQEQHFQTTMMLNKLQEQFSRIVMFMENMDNRLSRLESVTRDILDNSRRIQTTTESAPRSSISVPSPSPAPAPSREFNLVPAAHPAYVDRELQEDADAALARKLQLKEERRARKEEQKQRSTPSSRQTAPPPPPPASEKLEECPICQGRFPAGVIQVHAESCLEKLTPAQQEEKKKSGFFDGWFTKKKPEEKKPAPAPATPDVRMAPGTYFPQQPYMIPSYMPGMMPGTMPPGAQIVYYNPQSQNQPK